MTKSAKRISVVVLLMAVLAGSLISCARRASANGGSQALFERAGEDLDKELTGAKADGMPQSETELFGLAPTPSENAAPIYTSAIAEMGKHWKAYVVLQRLKGPSGSPGWRDAAKNLPLVEGALNKAQAAASLAHCWTGPDANFAPKVKQVAKALCAKARLQVNSGNTTAAMQTLEAAWKLGDQAGMEPTMSGFINSTGIKRMVCWTAEAIITDTKADRPVLLALQDTLRKLTSAPDARRAFQGVFVFMWDVYRPTLGGDGVQENLADINDRQILVPGVDDQTLIRAYVTRSIQLCRKLDAVFANAKLSSREKSLRMIAIYQDQWKQDDTYRLSRDTLENADVALLLPMAETWRKLVLNGISILLTSPPTGQFSKSLVVDIDPYTGAPFTYKATSTGFKLASQGVRAINPNITDDLVPSSSHVFSYPCNL